MRKTYGALAFTMLMVAAGQASAVSPFIATVSVNNSTVLDQGYTSITDLLNVYTQTSFSKLDPNNLPATSTINLRGLTGVELDYAPATVANGNQTSLHLQIPSLSIDKTFTASTLNESKAQLKSFLEGQGGTQIIGKIANSLAANSPIDPIAGNPGSLMATMASASFNAGAAGAGVSVGASGGAAVAGSQQSANFLALATHFDSYTQHGHETQIVSLPIAFSHEFSDSRYALNYDLPISYLKSDGAASGSISAGVSLRMPAAERWNLSPMLRAGAAGSEQLGAAGVIYSGGLLSDYHFLPVAGVKVTLLNMISYFKTNPIKIGNFNSGYNLTNMVYRNGVDLVGDLPFMVGVVPATWSAQVVRTDFRGDQLFCKYSNDFSVSAGTRHMKGQTLWNAFRLGVTYTYAGQGVHGFGVNMGYTF